MTAKAEETARLDRLLDLLEETGDILAKRVHHPEAPAWCLARGWEGYLRSIDDDQLRRAESHGLAEVLTTSPEAPPSLATLAERVDALTRVTDASRASDRLRTIRRVSERKRAQVESLSSLAQRLLGAPRRVVDVGAGLGHLTRVLADDLDCPAVGLEIEADRVEKARALTRAHLKIATEHRAARRGRLPRPRAEEMPCIFEARGWRQPAAPRKRGDRSIFEMCSKSATSFERVDARSQLPIRDGDLVVGLHACGDLGDAIVRGAAGAGADLLLVSCCLQKIGGEARQPLSRLANERGFVARRALLGLANVSIRPVGVETSMEGIMASRETRYALRLLLQGRGVPCAPGEESHGINRRRMNRGLAEVAPLALARRALAPASAHEIDAINARARREFSIIRRLSLPRAMLARALEVAVVADRASALEDAGYEARIVTAWRDDESPRNLTIVASPRATFSASGTSR